MTIVAFLVLVNTSRRMHSLARESELSLRHLAAALGSVVTFAKAGAMVSLLTLSVLMILRLSVIEFRPWIAGRDESTTGSQDMGTAAAKR